MNKKKGFTLIELLVVIAIIGILSAIVLASLSSARSKAQDAKTQGQLSSMRAAAEIYYGNNSNYGAMAALNGTTCTGGAFSDSGSGMANLVASTNYANGASPLCATDANPATKWAAWHVLSTGSFFCVDNSGSAKVEGTSTLPSSASPVCP
ncbi:MAG: type II secretion system protein [Candidatus Pacebacteria bacterium]|nr:type II secretion system protein [Candidatus Paceibacterota bacterium]